MNKAVTWYVGVWALNILILVAIASSGEGGMVALPLGLVILFFVNLAFAITFNQYVSSTPEQYINNIKTFSWLSSVVIVIWAAVQYFSEDFTYHINAKLADSVLSDLWPWLLNFCLLVAILSFSFRNKNFKPFVHFTLAFLSSVAALTLFHLIFP